MVFKSRDANVGWNGKFRGEEMAIGTYHYFFKYKCNNTEMKILKGDITLVK
ncbi:MAG: gliding motility-associated C-terminal domain-containing protein [Bacteroidetes bacterium]|nr:gliding motility-associated C-terminal domain-containing protein [Bacteroidota bacterium]